jgi:hypothetical protein
MYGRHNAESVYVGRKHKTYDIIHIQIYWGSFLETQMFLIGMSNSKLEFTLVFFTTKISETIPHTVIHVYCDNVFFKATVSLKASL